LQSGIEQEFVVTTAGQLQIRAGNAARAAVMLTRRFPELEQSTASFSEWNCDAAITLAAAWLRTGEDERARQLLARVATWLESSAGPRYPSATVMRAQVHALLGEREEAVAERGQMLALLHVDPSFDSLRGDRRMTTLLAGLGAPR